MRAHGFTYLALLFAVAIMGAVLAATAVVWSQVAQREKERELLFIGHEFRRAIGLYYERTPGTAKQYPKKLGDMLEDKRQIGLARYLRRIYTDPLTSSKEWGIVRGPGDVIVGVYSLSPLHPVKTGGFEEVDKEFEAASSFQDWKFIYHPQAPAAAATPAQSAANPVVPSTDTSVPAAKPARK